MAAGMKDVATLAGVAVGTVSNVLNHPDLVRPQTRARVEAAMEQLGFIPNASARQLRAGRSRCLGLVVLDVTNPFFTEVARGVEDYAQAESYAVILCNSDEAEDKERQYLRVLEEQRVRGILITPVHGRAPTIKGIRDRGTPVVLLDRPGPAGHCSVAVDDRRGGELAVAHLLALGHRRIALVNGPLAIRQCADRRRGAYEAVRKAGLDPAEVLQEVPVPAMNTRCGADAADQLRAAAAGTGAASPIPGPLATAAFCTNDLLALGLLRRLTQLGAQVPGDIAIVGYDDIDFAADSAVPLTSVRQPKYQLGQAAAELLLEEADRPAQHEHRRIVFTPELIVRASSEPEPARPAAPESLLAPGPSGHVAGPVAAAVPPPGARPALCPDTPARGVVRAGSEDAVDLVDLAARDTDRLVVPADGVLVRALQEAINLAVRVVVELDLPDAELVGGARPCPLRDLVDVFRRKLQVIVEIHEPRHVIVPSRVGGTPPLCATDHTVIVIPAPEDR